ncbi:MAG: AsmA-like C-terminal region-containing protein [Halieaceae bacterium]|jgi:uncharacterized protein (TIGR02099 family)|nr:AsmA-like C-terminal region-containing protein [Halieaceae bacterium]
MRGLHALAPWTWRGLVSGIVLLAVYVVLGRLFVSQLPALREPILAALNDRLPFTLEAQELTGSWHNFSPELRLAGVVLVTADSRAAPLALGGGRLRVDVPASIRSRSLQLSQLEVRGLSLQARLTQEGRIELEGLRAADSGEFRRWLETLLPNVERVSLRDSRLLLRSADSVFDLDLALSLEREGSARHLQGRLEGAAVTIAVDAAGVGNPLEPLSWRGDIFAEVSSPELADLSALWGRFDLPFSLSGEAATRFWLSRAGGESRARLSVDGRSVRLEERSGAWSLPVDEMSFEGALTQSARHWSLLTEDFHVVRAGETVDLDRAQFDWWGQALRVRLSDLGLDALPALLGAAPGIPEGLRAALPELAPRGQLDAVELRLDDLARPAQTWALRAGLTRVAIDSWRGTPALAELTGYLELGPDGGRLQLDAPGLRMHFPRVYREALAYDDAWGELQISWGPQSLRVDSGLLRVRGEEGEASGLFALDVPLVPRDTGIELDLLVGIADSAARYRDRYIPFRLPEALRDWLGASLREARLPRGSFLWRGSTRRGQADHRTAQLYLRLEEGRLAYDPAWPELEGLTGALWIDDVRSFGVIDRARSLDAQIQDLVFRILPQSGSARLDLAAGVHGDAAAGARLLADSPLAQLTGGVFADWGFRGALSGDLALSLALGRDGASPWVDLSLALDDVEARIAQIDLPLASINGQLNYNTETGFAGSLAEAEIFDGSLKLQAQPTPRRGGFDLSLAADFDVSALAPWLELDLLAFAEGPARFDGRLRLDDDKGARLSLASELSEVSFDIPAPFTKAPGQPLPLELSVALDGAPRLALRLGERLNMAFDFGKPGPASVQAMLGGDPVQPCEARFCLAGRLSTLDLAAWSEWGGRYLMPALPADASPDAGSIGAFSYEVTDLEVGELALGRRSLGSAIVDLRGVDTAWGGTIDAPWVTASLTRPGGQPTLSIEDLDIGDFGGASESAELDALVEALPTMRVDVARLRRGDRELGRFGFDLYPRPEERALYAANVTGELWGARIDDPAPGLLRWAIDEDGETTALELDTTFDDIGDVVTAAGFAPNLESDSGRAALRLRWPGPPSAFDIAAARGSLRIAAERGRVLEARPGPLALVGFLNFAEILRGLSVSQLFESGIPYEHATAELYLHGGTVEIADLRIDGAASAFTFSGVSDLELGEVNGELVVTLPVANNLPWMAALAGGLPVAAGVFVVSKVFEKQVNRMSSAVYSVSGAIEAPEVAFRRLFDDTLSAPTAVPEGSGTGDG